MEIENLKGAIIGTVMGDGNIHKSGFFRTASISKEYLEWKKNVLGELTEAKIRLDDKVNGWNKKDLYVLSTKVHPLYKKLRVRMYHNGVKTIDEYCLKTLNPLGLLWWYLDDGHLYEDKRGKSKGLGFFWHTQFNWLEYQYIQKYLNDRFELRTNLNQSFRKSEGKREFSLYLKAVDRLKFYDTIIAPYLDKIPESIKYKIPKRETIIELLNNPHNHKGSLEVYKKNIV